MFDGRKTFELFDLFRNQVKKFVYENQGLVRRMYGDMRHIFVMQSELENEADLDELQHSADKYSKAFNEHNQRQMKAKKPVVEKKNFRSDSEPYFRPAQRPSAINSKQKTKPPKTILNEPTDSNVILDNMIKSNIDAIVEDLKTKEENNSALEASIRTTKLTSVPSSSTTASTVQKNKNEKVIDKHFEDKSVATTIDKVVSNLFSNYSSPLTSMTSSTMNTSTTPSFDEESNDKLLSTLKNELEGSDNLEKLENEFEEETLNVLEQVASSDGEVSTESDGLTRNNSKEPQTADTTTETQLFQDTVQKEKDPTPVVNRRGV